MTKQNSNMYYDDFVHHPFDVCLKSHSSTQTMFDICDQFATMYNIPEDDRIVAHVHHILLSIMNNIGHTCEKLVYILEATYQSLRSKIQNVNVDRIRNIVFQQHKKLFYVLDDTWLFLHSVYKREVYIANRIRQLLQTRLIATQHRELDHHHDTMTLWKTLLEHLQKNDLSPEKLVELLHTCRNTLLDNHPNHAEVNVNLSNLAIDFCNHCEKLKDILKETSLGQHKDVIANVTKCIANFCDQYKKLKETSSGQRKDVIANMSNIAIDFYDQHEKLKSILIDQHDHDNLIAIISKLAIDFCDKQDMLNTILEEISIGIGQPQDVIANVTKSIAHFCDHCDKLEEILSLGQHDDFIANAKKCIANFYDQYETLKNNLEELSIEDPEDVIADINNVIVPFYIEHKKLQNMIKEISIGQHGDDVTKSIIHFCDQYEALKNIVKEIPKNVIANVSNLTIQVCDPKRKLQQDTLSKLDTFIAKISKKPPKTIPKTILQPVQTYLDHLCDAMQNKHAMTMNHHVQHLIQQYETEHHVQLHEHQRHVITDLFAFQTNMHILTGLPGTGKSSVVNCIRYIATHIAESVLICAPTGKAANRLGQDASTIHRALEGTYGDNHKFEFKRKEDNPFRQNIILVDEVSMLDLDMTYHLFRAIPNKNVRVLFLGDSNQLPSVSYGNVLQSLIEAFHMPKTHLTKIFRQAEGSLISKLSKAIIQQKLNGDHLRYYTQLNDDAIEYIHESNPRQVHKHILDIFIRHKKQDQDLMILVPTRKGEVGTDAINATIHRHLFKQDAQEKTLPYRKTERVICIANTYFYDEHRAILLNKSVFNGDMGTFVDYKNKDTVVIRVDNREHETEMEKSAIDFGYAITVHKSQGSEYDFMILVLHDSHGIMLNRQILYTGFTRAKKKLYVIGTDSCIQKCIERNNPKRHSALTQLLNAES